MLKNGQKINDSKIMHLESDEETKETLERLAKEMVKDVVKQIFQNGGMHYEVRMNITAEHMPTNYKIEEQHRRKLNRLKKSILPV
jgi:hypothetical protein